MQLECDAPVCRDLHHERQPLWREPAEFLLQRRVVPLAVLQDRLRETRSLLTEPSQVRNIEMRRGSRVRYLAAPVHPQQRARVRAEGCYA